MMILRMVATSRIADSHVEAMRRKISRSRASRSHRVTFRVRPATPWPLRSRAMTHPDPLTCHLVVARIARRVPPARHAQRSIGARLMPWPTIMTVGGHRLDVPGNTRTRTSGGSRIAATVHLRGDGGRPGRQG